MLSCAVVSDSLRSHGLQPARLLCPWDSPGKNTGVDLLQGIFPTQGLNPGLQYFRWNLNHLSHQGSTRILEWEACPFSRGSSWPRNQTRVSCIAGGFFTSWTTREAQCQGYILSTWLFIVDVNFDHLAEVVNILSLLQCKIYSSFLPLFFKGNYYLQPTLKG